MIIIMELSDFSKAETFALLKTFVRSTSKASFRFFSLFDFFSSPQRDFFLPISRASRAPENRPPHLISQNTTVVRERSRIFAQF